MPNHVRRQSFVIAALSLFAAFSATAGDEVCVVNKTGGNVQAWAWHDGPDGDPIAVASNDAFCTTVTVAMSAEGVGSEGGGIGVISQNNVKLLISIDDPLVGPLEFDFSCTLDGVQFDCDLSHSDAQKGDDGVYRVFIQ